MIGLHVLDDEVIRLFAVKRFFQLIQPLVREAFVHGVHDRGLVVLHDVGIVSHAVRHDVLTFEEVDLVIVDAGIQDVVRDSHRYLRNNILI